MTHSATHIANAHLYQKLPYDTLNDFIGVTTLAKQVGVLVAPVAARDVGEAIHRAGKKAPRRDQL